VGPQIAARLAHRGFAEGTKISRHDAPSTRDISAGDSPVTSEGTAAATFSFIVSPDGATTAP